VQPWVAVVAPSIVAYYPAAHVIEVQLLTVPPFDHVPTVHFVHPWVAKVDASNVAYSPAAHVIGVQLLTDPLLVDPPND